MFKRKNSSFFWNSILRIQHIFKCKYHEWQKQTCVHYFICVFNHVYTSMPAKFIPFYLIGSGILNFFTLAYIAQLGFTHSWSTWHFSELVIASRRPRNITEMIQPGFFAFLHCNYEQQILMWWYQSVHIWNVVIQFSGLKLFIGGHLGGSIRSVGLLISAQVFISPLWVWALCWALLLAWNLL